MRRARPAARLSACYPVVAYVGPVFAALRQSLLQKKHSPVRPQPRFWQSARTRFSRNKNIDVLVSSSRNIAALTNVTLGGGGDAFPPAERLPERSEGWPANSSCWKLRCWTRRWTCPAQVTGRCGLLLAGHLVQRRKSIPTAAPLSCNKRVLARIHTLQLKKPMGFGRYLHSL